MAGNEVAAFPVDVNTVCCHDFQGSTVGEYGADRGANGVTLTENSNPTSQATGYGQDVKADGEDVGRYNATGGAPYDEALVSANNAALKETGDHIVELILEPVGYGGWQASLGGLWSTGIGSYYGLEIYFLSTGPLRAYWGKGSSQRCIIESTSIGSLVDKFYVAWRYDSAGAGGVYGSLFYGNLSTPDANLTKSTNVVNGTQGAIAYTTNHKLVVHNIQFAGLIRSGKSEISSHRFQAGTFSDADLETRFDDVIKAWPAGGALRRDAVLNGVGRGIGRGMRKDDKCGLIEEPTLRETIEVNSWRV